MTRHRPPTEDPWRIDAGAAPRHGEPASLLHFALGYAVLAPSSHNTQPWLFRIDGDAVEVFADRTRALSVVDPDDRELEISCGAAIGTLEVALAGLGHASRVTVCEPADGENADRLAWVRLAGEAPADAEAEALLHAIPRRRTTRSAFYDDRTPTALLDRCRAAAEPLGTGFVATGDPDVRRDLARLVAEADRRQFADPAFRRELASWMHPRRARSRDGLGGAGFGLPDLLTPLGAAIVRTFDIGGGAAAKDSEKIAAHTPALALLSAAGDGRAARLAVGRALARVLLTLASEGWTAAYLNQPIEVDALRPRVAEILPPPPETPDPHLLLRIGRGPEIAPSPRRPVDAVLQEEV